MINIASCEFDSDRLSTSGIDALNQILDKIDRANMLSKATAAIPFFDIFLRGKPHEKLTNIATYDWEEFANVMLSINRAERRMIEDIAGRTMLETTGKEYEFWKCVHYSVY